MRAELHIPRYLAFLICLLCIAAGAAVTYFWPLHQTMLRSGNGIIREGGYPFINPLISCNLYEDAPTASFNPLKTDIARVIQESLQQGDATRIAFYFRDVNFGYWTGVNENDTFAPASLSKVPVMMAYLHQARVDPTLLTHVYNISKVETSTKTEHFAPSVALKVGEKKTGQELFEAMIERSDNTAAAMLISQIATTSWQDLYSLANVPPVDDPAANQTSPKEFMTFLRMLYNASYLGRTNSQRAFEFLAQTEFTQGLVAGLPKNTTVAHKFGERTVQSENGQVQSIQLHDCGIVYLSGQPYGICVMTEGHDFEKLAGVIAKISNVAYTHVNSGLLSRLQE